MSAEHEHSPYYKILAWLTFLTISEIIWAMPNVGLPRGLMIGGLAVMAAIKVCLVALYYMHLKYEAKLLWGVILFPCLLVIIMISGFLPDAFHYW